LIEDDLVDDKRVIKAKLIENNKSEYSRSDVLAKHRALIRHDPEKLAEELKKIVDSL